MHDSLLSSIAYTLWEPCIFLHYSAKKCKNYCPLPTSLKQETINENGRATESPITTRNSNDAPYSNNNQTTKMGNNKQETAPFHQPPLQAENNNITWL
jgi:rRNA maturation protein Nop10